MAFTASAVPPSGPAPGSFVVQCSGGEEPYSVVPGAVPNPFPDHTITPDPNDPEKFIVEIHEAYSTPTAIEFDAVDDDDQAFPVTYTTT